MLSSICFPACCKATANTKGERKRLVQSQTRKLPRLCLHTQKAALWLLRSVKSEMDTLFYLLGGEKNTSIRSIIFFTFLACDSTI